MLNNYAESGGGFNSNHGQTSRTTEGAAKQHNIGSTWSSYNSQLEGMYYGSGEQAMFMGPYDGSTKHANYPQYPHQPVPTPMVKCQEACCQHFQDRYPLNPAPLRYQPTQPRYDDSRQYFTDRRSMQPTLSRKKAYPTDNSFAGIPDRHYSQFMSRGQFMPDSRQQMQQMMRSQYPMYPPYWGSTRSYGPRMNCPPPPYHQSVSQGAQLQAGLKMTDPHYMDATQKSLGTQRHRTVGSSGGSEIIRPVPEPKRSVLDPNLQSCYEFGYPGGFVPFGEVNKIQGTGVSQNGTSCKIPSDKQYHPHQMQYAMQGSDRSMMNCSNPINELSYSMNFALPTGDPYIRAGLDDGQSISDSRKANLQYDSSLGKKRPDLDLRQYLATWEDDEEEGTRLSEPLALGNSGAPYIVVDCRSLEGEAAAKIQERFKTSQNCSSKSRSSSPSNERKRIDESNRSNENPENSTLSAEFQNQPSFAPSMPNLLNDNDKGVSFWNGAERDGEGISGKNSAFQPLDCSKRDNNVEHSKNDPQTHSELPTNKVPSTETGSMSFDNLVSYYGDTRRISDGAYDFVEMTERLVNNTDKSAVNSHQVPPAMTRPCDPRLQQSQMGNNPSIYNKVTPRYSAGNFQHYKPPVHPDPYYNFKHPINPNKYLPYDNTQILDPNYDYHKLTSDFDPARLYSNKDLTKDPRRLFHQELDKAAESAFLDPVRKAQLNDCYQEKVHCEFPNGDPNTFMPPLMVKKSDLIGRDKLYSDKNHSIRERMDVINNENQNPAEKTVLITSQNGPPEIFRVPFPPEKESSHKDNVVTLHSGDQTKSNTITVEVPYVQQYSTLVELSEEISRVENGDGKNKSKPDVLVPSKSTNDEAKKPTSFKLKRLPNSKEWAVENKALLNSKTQVATESNTGDSESTPRCEVSGEKDCLNPPLTSSNLNMPSLDDFREEENCASLAENLSKNKVNEPSDVGNKVCSSNVDDSNKGNKYNAQPPQMAIVQPMKLNKCDVNQIESNQSCKLSINDSHDNQLDKPNGSIGQNQNSFDPEKLITSTSSNLELMSEDISKHENFRTHKKIQSFPARIPTCLPSPSEEFLHSQEMGNHKETYSPFHVYSDCDMNSQINDFFKMDDRNTSNNKDLNNRMPSSPSVEGMFEDINHSNESSENETGLEDQLSPLAECANSLNLKQSSNNKEPTNFTDKLTPLIENDNSNNLEKPCKSKDVLPSTANEIESRSTLKVGGETPNENEEEDGSTPLKDKVCFFNQKESVFLRRDSLKILEREAVLREIFSPEPESDYTESKENAYPGIFNQHKPENSKLQYCENVDTNDDLSSSVNDSTNFKGFSESSVQEVSNQNSGVYSPPSKTEIAQSEQNEISVSSSIELQPHKNKMFVDSPSEMDDSFKENLRENSKPALQKPALPETESNDNQPSFLSTKLNNFNYLLNRSIEESAHDQKSKGKTEENQSTSSSEDLNLLRTVQNSPLNNESHPMSPEENSFLCQDRDILSPNHEDVSNESTISCTDMTSDNVSCNDSNTNDISTKVAPNEDTNATLLVTGKDVLFSTTQPVDDQDDEALNNSVSHKETYNSDMSFDDGVDDDQTHNITQSQNEKITSVHDSLRNNQHLNKETFPLQCLVEAALALEHVGSKQMLLNNSNFPGLYSQSDEGFVESPLSESPSHESLDYSTKTNTADEILDRKKIKNNHSIVDGDSFSKFEETHYNLRDSTRIVTSSSCNIIPYPKRKYRFKSVKSSCATHEMKQRETDTVVNDKIKSKKRKSVFAYPRTKRRKRNTKDKPKTSDVLPEPITQDATEVDSNTHHYDESIQNDYNREDSLQNHCENIEPCLNTGTNTMNCSNNTSDYKTSSQLTNDSSHLTDDESKNNFGGPLLIANEDTTAQGNIFCVHVDSEKIDDYVGGLGILSDTNHSLFKESTDGIESEIPNVSLDNSTSLVIIIEDLDENAGKMQFDNGKSESDVMLGSVRDADCADVLTTELSVNESCICPPDIGLKNACENELKSKLLYGRSEELLTTNCYEEINENLINDIGNWPFVEEEVAEFDDRSEFPNKIPEEGRKIELKFVKVSRLILQRESDNSSSSYSEKDSEEENENRKLSVEHSDGKSTLSVDSYLTENISQNENWQPIVVLKRNKELDELTSRLQSQTFTSLSNSQSSSSDESKDEESSEHSDTDSWRSVSRF
ncbi:uncharacterized protein LOC128997392 [Macrosteles quadrilineatus]|uniref:uncharacterized protein LOC128997392 n=1 Tax=Macrosteles quadrilineatus TaxID=74068 RepID=UPI0023E299D5|nr:uncharacterized protein LOC128997392 [Macrosteles quadrilineatus]